MTEILREGWKLKTGGLDFKVTQASASECAHKLLAALRSSGAPEEDIREVEMGDTGGDCPWCKKPWRKVHVSGDVHTSKMVENPETGRMEKKDVLEKGYFGEFDYYKPVCFCYRKWKDEQESITGNNTYMHERLIEAKVPRTELDSTFANWDWNVKTALNDQLKACCDWVRAGEWRNGAGLIMCGAVGTGKTRCAISIIHEILANEPERRVRFLPMADLLGSIIKDTTESGYIEALLTNEMIIVDDLDKVPADKEWARAQVFSFYDACLREGISLVGTTNLTGPDEMIEKFDYAIVSRIMGKCKFLKYAGTRENDYRLIRRKQEKGAGK